MIRREEGLITNLTLDSSHRWVMEFEYDLKGKIETERTISMATCWLLMNGVMVIRLEPGISNT